MKYFQRSCTLMLVQRACRTVLFRLLGLLLSSRVSWREPPVHRTKHVFCMLPTRQPSPHMSPKLTTGTQSRIFELKKDLFSQAYLIRWTQKGCPMDSKFCDFLPSFSPFSIVLRPSPLMFPVTIEKVLECLNNELYDAGTACTPQWNSVFPFVFTQDLLSQQLRLKTTAPTTLSSLPLLPQYDVLGLDDHLTATAFRLKIVNPKNMLPMTPGQRICVADISSGDTPLSTHYLVVCHVNGGEMVVSSCPTLVRKNAKRLGSYRPFSITCTFALGLTRS